MNEKTALTFSQRHPRFVLLMVFAACAAPIVASFLTYYVWQPAKLMNHGEIMPTIALPEGSFVDEAGVPVKLHAQGKWTLLVLDSGACDDECQVRLYDVRQVFLSFEMQQDRLQRVWAISDNKTPAAALLKQHEGLRLVHATPALTAFFPQPSVGRIYLLDNQGNQVLRYMPKPEPKRMIKDISRLLLIKKM